MPPQRIKISSVDRISGTPSDFTIQSKITFDGIYQLNWVYCPLTFPNVTERNNKIYFRESGVDKVAEIEPGYYIGISNLMTAVGTALTTSSGVNVYTVSQDALSGLISIESDTVEFEFTFTNLVDSAAEVLGFASGVYVESDSLVLTAIRNPNLATLQNLNIDINGISTVMSTSGNAQATITVPILSDLLSICYFKPPDNSPELFEFPQKTTTLRIRVTDDQQKVVPLESEWHMVVTKV